MAITGVIFDWGGTLTPWHTIDHGLLWREICTPHFPGDQVHQIAAAILAAELELWETTDRCHQSATLEQVFERAGVPATEAILATYFEAWDQHTPTDPEVAPLLAELRSRGIRTGVLSNTMWPRSAHERIFLRDNVLHLLDGAVYTSEIPWCKPHPAAFRAAMDAIGVDDPASCVFVGDRPYDDIYGAKEAGMRAVFIPHSDVPAFGEAAPDAVITRLSELPRHLDAW